MVQGRFASTYRKLANTKQPKERPFLDGRPLSPGGSPFLEPRFGSASWLEIYRSPHQELVKEEVKEDDEEEIQEEVEYGLTEEDLARLKEPIRGAPSVVVFCGCRRTLAPPKKGTRYLEYIYIYIYI